MAPLLPLPSSLSLNFPLPQAETLSLPPDRPRFPYSPNSPPSPYLFDQNPKGSATFTKKQQMIAPFYSDSSFQSSSCILSWKEGGEDAILYFRCCGVIQYRSLLFLSILASAWAIKRYEKREREEAESSREGKVELSF